MLWCCTHFLWPTSAVRPAPLSPHSPASELFQPWSCIYNSSADTGVEEFMSLETTLSHWDESSMRGIPRCITQNYSEVLQKKSKPRVVLHSHQLTNASFFLVLLFCLTLSTRSVRLLGITSQEGHLYVLQSLFQALLLGVFKLRHENVLTLGNPLIELIRMSIELPQQIQKKSV